MPAIGARTTGDSMVWRPICSGGRTGARAVAPVGLLVAGAAVPVEALVEVLVEVLVMARPLSQVV
jgi:hypothetical protein